MNAVDNVHLQFVLVVRFALVLELTLADLVLGNLHWQPWQYVCLLAIFEQKSKVSILVLESDALGQGEHTTLAEDLIHLLVTAQELVLQVYR